jgi:Na+-driven multidrug efflux pump
MFLSGQFLSGVVNEAVADYRLSILNKCSAAGIVGLNAVGNGTYSLIITLMRVAVVLLPALYIFVRIFAINQVWWAFVLAEGFSALVGAFLLHRIYTRRVAPIKQ